MQRVPRTPVLPVATNKGRARERLTAGIYVSADPQDILGRLEHALKLMSQMEMVEHKINSAIKDGRLKLSAGMDRAEQANAAKLIDAAE